MTHLYCLFIYLFIYFCLTSVYSKTCVTFVCQLSVGLVFSSYYQNTTYISELIMAPSEAKMFLFVCLVLNDASTLVGH